MTGKIAGNKEFKSKSAEHVLRYPVVWKTKNYGLSFGVVKYVYEQIYSVVQFVNTKLSGITFFYDTLSYVDKTFDKYALGSVDRGIKFVSGLDTLNPLVYAKRAEGWGEKRLLKPGNDWLVEKGRKYLKTSTGEEAGFVYDEVTQKNEFSRFFRIAKEFLKRSTAKVSQKVSGLQKKVTSEYDKEVGVLENQYSNYSKKAVASYNTGRNFLKDLHTEYVTPLTNHAQNLAHRGAEIQSESVSQLKDGVASLEKKMNNVSNELDKSTPVRASA